MKKLMFTLAMIATAIGVQANCVDWQVTINSAGSLTAGNYTAYLLDYSVWSTYVDSGTMDSAYLTSAAYDSSAFYTETGKTYIKTGKDGAPAIRTADVGSASTVDYAIILFDSANNKYSLLKSAENFATYDPEQGNGTVQSTSTTGAKVLGTASSGNLVWNTVSGGGSDIPEPTSGLLLVLGGAMLALRRRR